MYRKIKACLTVPKGSSNISLSPKNQWVNIRYNNIGGFILYAYKYPYLNCPLTDRCCIYMYSELTSSDQLIRGCDRDPFIAKLRPLRIFTSFTVLFKSQRSLQGH